ncbi:MAG TPA: hypothetical protein VGH45_07760 [Solirubrobacteraceae bacterium]
MSDERPPGVLGGLPRTRPHRRSDKRPAQSASRAQPAQAQPASRAQPAQAQPAPKPTSPSKPRSPTKPRPSANPRSPATPRSTVEPPAATGPLGTAVQAAAELAEIGLTASARALRGALSRLPRP